MARTGSPIAGAPPQPRAGIGTTTRRVLHRWRGTAENSTAAAAVFFLPAVSNTMWQGRRHHQRVEANHPRPPIGTDWRLGRNPVAAAISFSLCSSFCSALSLSGWCIKMAQGKSGEATHLYPGMSPSSTDSGLTARARIFHRRTRRELRPGPREAVEGESGTWVPHLSGERSVARGDCPQGPPVSRTGKRGDG